MKLKMKRYVPNFYEFIGEGRNTDAIADAEMNRIKHNEDDDFVPYKFEYEGFSLEVDKDGVFVIGPNQMDDYEIGGLYRDVNQAIRAINDWSMNIRTLPRKRQREQWTKPEKPWNTKE